MKWLAICALLHQSPYIRLFKKTSCMLHEGPLATTAFLNSNEALQHCQVSHAQLRTTLTLKLAACGSEFLSTSCMLAAGLPPV
jgi:hypothetical protein